MTLQLLKRYKRIHAPCDTAPSVAPNLQYRYVHGYRRAFIHVGTGPALLLIHGIGDSSSTWQEIIPQLAQRYTVIAPDLLGHGRSDKPRADYSVAGYANAMRDLITMLGIETATVVGHSLGGGVAMQFAYQYPERCERLVLVSSGGVSDDVNTLLRLAATPNADLMLALASKPSSLTVASWLCKLLQRYDHDLGLDAPDLMRMLGTLPDVNARRAFLCTLRSAVDWRGQSITMLDRVYLTQRVPTLLIWGARDAVIPVEHARLAHEAMPYSSLEVFEGAGHFPFRSDPKRFIDALERFITETDPATHDTVEWCELLRRGPEDRALAI